MNQIKKRLSIINLAISITDIETIQLQVLKLSPIKTDTKIQHILQVLQAKNYAQAQTLISAYIDEPTKEILQRTSQTASISDEDQAIIDEFDLFVTSPSSSSEGMESLDVNDYLSEPTPSVTPHKTFDFDALLNLNPDEVLPDNIDIDISDHTKTDPFFDEPKKEEKHTSTQDIPKDTFFDTPKTSDTAPKSLQEDPYLELPKENDEQNNTIQPLNISPNPTPLHYPPMVHIAQKLIHMNKQYPPIQPSSEKFDTVEMLLSKIATEGYTESEIEDSISLIHQLIKKEHYTEASQLLLLCGATKSRFAQFTLARELFKGAVLVKNIQESFALMHALATEDYPEALCDMGQFYEHGIGTKKDTIKAENFYKEAVNLGIKRAKKHYERLKKQNRKLFK